ncbi:MAG: 6,7-dimethyl-8-ribityllumazine synthase [Actinobacteria bacterium]|nr:6,7-dimethyl-8-ribityllumazine synthase [Actinomycetota bacterium]
MKEGTPGFSGDIDATGLHAAVVAARFNADVVELLAEGAVHALVERGATQDDIHVHWVPGAFELPVVARRLAATGRYDLIVTLGAVIRGDTPHFDFVAGEAARGVGQVAYDHGIPVAFGVLTTDTHEQAMARAGGGHGNKGAEAALAAIETANLLARIDTEDT